jgi:hypothetical protein
MSKPISQKISLFLQSFGKGRLFKGCKKIFQAGAGYRPFAEYCLLSIRVRDADVNAFDLACDDFLQRKELEYLLRGLVGRSLRGDVSFDGEPSLIMDHFSKTWDEPRKYLIDWLLLARFRPYIQERPAGAKKLGKFLRFHSKKSSDVQRFYSGLLLGSPLQSVSERQLGVSTRIFHALMGIARSVAPIRGTVNGKRNAQK